MPQAIIIMDATLHQQTLFEHPLNEKCRTLLRLSRLFEQFEFYLPRESQRDSRAALLSLLDINAILTRPDIKSDFIKELERHSLALNKMSGNRNVDQVRLQQVLEEISNLNQALKNTNAQLGQSLRANEFLKSITQRINIPGGSFEFDLPQLHYWLHMAHTERVMQLDGWRHEISLVQETTDLLLTLIRNSTIPTDKVAIQGAFQQTLDPQRSTQMIRIRLPLEDRLYPEISGSKHRFSIRFMEANHWEHPVQTHRDVSFQLTTCVI